MPGVFLVDLVGKLLLGLPRNGAKSVRNFEGKQRSCSFFSPTKRCRSVVSEDQNAGADADGFVVSILSVRLVRWRHYLPNEMVSSPHSVTRASTNLHPGGAPGWIGSTAKCLVLSDLAD